MSRYAVRASKRYKKHLKRIAKRNSDHVRNINEVVGLLATGEPLPERYKDHALLGNWSGHRECHVLSDLLLIYRLIDDVLVLELVDTGSHSDLFKK